MVRSYTYSYQCHISYHLYIMFEFIEKLKPYFYSLRLIKDKISVDLRIPTSWIYEHLLNEHVTYRVQDSDGSVNLVSFITEYTEENINSLNTITNKVIEYNLEEEQKKLLLNQKIKELEELFQKESLDKLKQINFNET